MTSFWHLMELSKVQNINWGFVTAMVEQLDPDRVGFTVERDVVSFDAKEFSMVIGLPFSGNVVVDSRRSMAELMKRIFKDPVMKLNSLTRVKIAKELKDFLAGGNTLAEVLEDVKRLFAALVWSMLLSPRHISHCRCSCIRTWIILNYLLNEIGGWPCGGLFVNR